MVADRGPVAGLAVQGAVESGGAGGGHGRPGPGRAEAHGGPGGAQPVGEAGAGCGESALAYGAAHGSQAVGEVALDVDVTGDVRLREAQFARFPQEAAQGAAGPDVDQGAVGGAGLAAVPHAHPDREPAAEELLDEGFDALGGTVGGAFVGECHAVSCS